MKILEISCHGVPWIVGTVLLFLFSHKSEDIEMSVNLFFGKFVNYVQLLSSANYSLVRPELIFCSKRKDLKPYT